MLGILIRPDYTVYEWMSNRLRVDNNNDNNKSIICLQVPYNNLQRMVPGPKCVDHESGQTSN